MTPIAMMVGACRVLPGGGIIHPAGNAELDEVEEKRFRFNLFERALDALEERVESQKLFGRD